MSGKSTLCLSWYLEAILSLTQLSIAQWSFAVMADRSEAPREGDVSAPALCQELLVLHLLIHINGNPELMLRGRPAQGQNTGPQVRCRFQKTTSKTVLHSSLYGSPERQVRTTIPVIHFLYWI